MSVGSVAESVNGLSTCAATGAGGGAASSGSSATGLAAGLFTTARVAPLTATAPVAMPAASTGRVWVTSLTTSPVARRSPALIFTVPASLAAATRVLKRPASSPGMVTTSVAPTRVTLEPGMSRTISPLRRPAESPAALTTSASGAASSTKRNVACPVLAGALGGPLALTVVRVPATTATAAAAAGSARLAVLTTPSVALMVVTPWAICTPKAVPCTLLAAVGVCTS